MQLSLAVTSSPPHHPKKSMPFIPSLLGVNASPRPTSGLVAPRWACHTVLTYALANPDLKPTSSSPTSWRSNVKLKPAFFIPNLIYHSQEVFVGASESLTRHISPQASDVLPQNLIVSPPGRGDGTTAACRVSSHRRHSPHHITRCEPRALSSALLGVHKDRRYRQP